MSTKKRSANFELLRIVSMMMIVMLHLLGNDHGNVLSKTTEFSAVWIITWGIEAFCTVAVNCYVLLSGYFLIGSKDSEDLDENGRPIKVTIRKVLDICITVWFYTIVLFGIAFVFGWTDASRSTLLHLVTPITGRTYWFVSVYLGLYVISPYLNKLIKGLGQKSFKRLIITSFCMFSILPTVLPVYDTFLTGGGIGIVWFIVLYFVAAYIRLYGLGKFDEWTSRKWFLTYLVMTILILLSKVIIATTTQRLLGQTIGTSLFYQYYTPLCLLSAVCLFMAFNTMRVGKKAENVVLKLSPLMFGVYIIHENPSIKGKMWELVSPDVSGNVFLLVLKLIGIVLGITVVCLGIEWVRQKAFRLIEDR